MSFLSTYGVKISDSSMLYTTCLLRETDDAAPSICAPVCYAHILSYIAALTSITGSFPRNVDYACHLLWLVLQRLTPTRVREYGGWHETEFPNARGHRVAHNL